MKFGHRQWRPFLHTYMQTYTHIPFHFLASHSILFFSLPFWFEICVRGLPQTLIRSACNMLSIVSGQEVGKQDECDRKKCGLWYDAVRLNQHQMVCVWKKASSSRYTPELVKYVFSQRFLEANAIIIQTFFRLHQMRVPLERRRPCIRLLFYIGRAGVILFDQLRLDPTIRHWVRPHRSPRGRWRKLVAASGVAEKPVAWMSHLSGLCVTQLRGHALASESCLDQPTEPTRKRHRHH